ncbi:MAG: heme-binding protein [Actinobacteria bacterium]|nr:heme-binding protein [Actinomycetota bacterium]
MSEPIAGQDIGIDLAQQIIAAARSEAERQGHLVSIVVADRAGNPVATARMDGSPLGAYYIAVDKAYSSALWNCRTGEMAELSMPGNGDWGFAKTIGGRMIVFAGGVSVRKDGEQIGAMGISGALSEEDQAMCLAALASLGLEG